jgi:hypothetical protein
MRALPQYFPTSLKCHSIELRVIVRELSYRIVLTLDDFADICPFCSSGTVEVATPRPRRQEKNVTRETGTRFLTKIGLVMEFPHAVQIFLQMLIIYCYFLYVIINILIHMEEPG